MDHRPDFTVLLHLPRLLWLAGTSQGITLLVVLILFLLLVSFFVSGAEVAFFSLSYKDVNMLKTKQDAGWKRIVSLLEDPKTLLASLLIASTFINIAIIILSNFLIDEMLELQAALWIAAILKVIIISFFLVLFGKVLPKVWASQNNLRFAYNASYIVEIIHYLFRRISTWMVSVSDSIEHFLGKKASSYSLEELDSAIDITASTDASEKEKSILKGIVKFGNITVKQVMTTRLDVCGVNQQISFHELIKKVADLHYSRLPVYKENLDEVTGIIHTKDILPHLNDGNDFRWLELLRQPYFVHEQKLIEDLLQEFQAKRIHFAVVVDEFGGTSGIVTMEDILEEITGDIKDEFDDEESGESKIDDYNYIFEGRTMINDVCKVMDLPVDTFERVRGDSDSLAGLILEIAGHFPAVNDTVTSGDFDFTILELDRNRIKKVKIAVKPVVK
ncbi:MAG TPA: gliding motility-associated protein GldE [Chitinophagaceae bacterium]|nr:gliding motility-associated protein GldE [Chitinophagaceae bacterium]